MSARGYAEFTFHGVRVVRKPELKYTTSGIAVVNFDVASNDKDVVHYLRVKIWGKTAELMMERNLLEKGYPLHLKGRVTQERYERSDGSKGEKIVFVALYSDNLKTGYGYGYGDGVNRAASQQDPDDAPLPPEQPRPAPSGQDDEFNGVPF